MAMLVISHNQITVNQWIYWVLFGVGLIEQESIRLLGSLGPWILQNGFIWKAG